MVSASRSCGQAGGASERAPDPSPQGALTLHPHPRCEEEVQVLVQQGLVAGVPRAELLQELVCVAQDLHHLGIALGTERMDGRRCWAGHREEGQAESGSELRLGVGLGQGLGFGPQRSQV